MPSRAVCQPYLSNRSKFLFLLAEDKLPLPNIYICCYPCRFALLANVAF